MKQIKLVIVGFGMIGRALARTLVEKHGVIKKISGSDLTVVGICEKKGSIIDESGINLDDVMEIPREDLKKHSKWTSKTSLEIIGKTDCNILLELTPGNIETGEPGLTHIQKALENGIHVVTSNKAPLAIKFSQLNDLAIKNNVKLLYEATVGGAIPVINMYKKNLRVNKIESIHGILNGTSNFVLCKMAEENVTLEIALKEAQELGIAEWNPDYDIKGIDTAVKVVILANSLMEKNVSFRDIRITGIDEITPETIELAKNHNKVIKLIGDVSNLEVSPRLIPINHPLNVNGTLNAIMFNTDVAGDITIIGRGAGPRETSSSIMSDILEIIPII